MASKVLSRMVRKVVFGVSGHLLGGYAGKLVADHIEHVFHVSESVAIALDISPCITGKSMETVSEFIGAISGGIVLEELKKFIWHEDTIHSEIAPDNPIEGQIWFKPSTRQLDIWTGHKWLGLPISS